MRSKRTWLTIGALVAVSALTACGTARHEAAAPIVIVTGTTSSTPAAQPAPPPAGGGRIDAATVEHALHANEPDATLGALVIDRISHEALLSVNPTEQFRSASLVKLLIAIDRVVGGAGPGDRELIVRMIAFSDDAIASEFWVQGGRSDLVARMSARIGLTGTEPPENPGQWGDVRLTAVDVANTYQYILTQLGDVDRELIVGAMERAPRQAADGWDQYFGIPEGLGAPWGIKQGWGNNDEAKVVHSTGLVGEGRRYIVVLLTRHPLDVSWEQATGSVTAAAASFRDVI